MSYNGTGINREDLSTNGIITVRVQALSNGLTAVTDIAVTVNDLDEFDPVFVDSTDTITLSINENLSSKVFTEDLAASDSDSTNNTITYTLSNDALVGLAINSATGEISYNGSAFNAESTTISVSYSFTVIAMSNGKSTTKNVVLNVSDVDEFDPVFMDTRDFTISPASLGIDEDAISKTFSANFSVTDDDVDSVIEYSLGGGECRQVYQLILWVFLVIVVIHWIRI